MLSALRCQGFSLRSIASQMLWVDSCEVTIGSGHSMWSDVIGKFEISYDKPTSHESMNPWSTSNDMNIYQYVIDCDLKNDYETYEGMTRTGFETLVWNCISCGLFLCRVHSISRCGSITERTERTEYDEGTSPGVAKLPSMFRSASFGHYFQIFSGSCCRFILVPGSSSACHLIFNWPDQAHRWWSRHCSTAWALTIRRSLEYDTVW